MIYCAQSSRVMHAFLENNIFPKRESWWRRSLWVGVGGVKIGKLYCGSETRLFVILSSLKPLEIRVHCSTGDINSLRKKLTACRNDNEPNQFRFISYISAVNENITGCALDYSEGYYRNLFLVL